MPRTCSSTCVLFFVCSDRLLSLSILSVRLLCSPSLVCQFECHFNVNILSPQDVTHLPVRSPLIVSLRL
uniref:Putative secreted protein n=1 Tax=Anopheles darlingi TaxID=43151 RepID=A0A2M4D2P6_ANODA